MAAVAAPVQRDLIRERRSTLDGIAEAEQYLKSRLKSVSSSAAPSFTTLPIIDLKRSFSTALRDRQSVAKEINAACTTSGFFYITNHGVPAATCSGALKTAERFFKELPDEKKERLHVKHSAIYRGWAPVDSDAAELTEGSGECERAADKWLETKECFNWAYQEELDPTGGDGKYVDIDGKRIEGNVWPDEQDLPGFFEGVKAYYSEILQLSRHLFRLFALSLALPETYFDHLMTHPGGACKFLYYHPNKDPQSLKREVNENILGIRPHTDFDCFTLLLQSDSPGLEILSPDGRWISAPPLEGGIVVNVADFLMRLTNGIYKSTIHRVVNRTPRERYSIPFFFSINYDETVETLPSCISDSNPSRYAPIKAGQYILERLSQAMTED